MKLIVIGLVRTVVSMSHCGCVDPGSIPGLVKIIFWGVVFLFFHMHILCEFLLCPYCTDISKMSICMEIIIMHKGLQTGGGDT